MKRIFLALLASLVFITTQFSYGRVTAYGERLCQSNADVHCITIQKGQSWASLWPDAADRNKVQRLNRMNTMLRVGMQIAVPNNLQSVNLLDLSPFNSNISAQGKKTIIVDLYNLAWGAYDAQGHLVTWGPVSGGKDYCTDVKRGCRSPVGSYSMYTKRGAGCFSSKYPVGKGGAPMPYCMFFKGGYAMHGSNTVPGYHASHGCIRIFNDDARWLNTEFVNMPGSADGATKVIVKPYDGSGSALTSMSV